MKTRFADLVRLLPATLLLATAALAVVPAPTHFLWMVAIGATEWGHALALMCLTAAALLWSRRWSGRVAAGFCIAAAFLALTPLIRAARLSRTLHVPIAYSRLFLGLSVPATVPQRLTYATTGNEVLPLDFYAAKSERRAPLIVVVHGGSWSSGDNTDFVGFDRYFAARGFAVADLIYRLAPRWPYPAASDDLRSAMRFLTLQSGTLNIDPDRIVLLGRSAGAQIALDVAYAEPAGRVRGVISFYGPTDLRWSWDHPGNPLVIDTRKALADYLGGDPEHAGSRYDAASPISHARPGVPPTLLFHGERDELVSSYHSAALSRRLTEAGVPNVNVALPWATHGFDYVMRGPGGQITTSLIERFLQQVLPHD